MAQFAILLQPTANRVYADAAVRLVGAELDVFGATALDGRLTAVAPAEIGGVPYLTFTAPALSDRDVAFLSNLSGLYALFEVRDGLLAPLPVRGRDVFDDDLVTILKYPGKTNEQFTKLLLNVTVLATSSPADLLDRRLTVFDPLCGRGTTLNQALRYGWHAAGMDTDAKDFEAYGAFIRTWLKNKRLKHHADAGPVRRNRAVIARRLEAGVGVTKEAWKAGDQLRLTMVQADTVRCGEFFADRSADVIVTDAPYGVQHGSRAAAGRLARTPTDLLTAALPGWVRVLRPGGALGISWNTHVAGRDELAKLLVDAGLEPVNTPAYRSFAHRVDQSIHRDLIVARKG